MTEYKSIDVRIQLLNLGQDYTKRIPAPVTFEALQQVVKSCIQKASPNAKGASFRVRYEDIDGLQVVVDDNSDLEIAYTLCLTDTKKITFLIEIAEQQSSSAMQVDSAEMPTEASSGKKSGKAMVKNNGLPRKALKQLIQAELTKQAKPALTELLKDKTLGQPMEDAEERKEPLVSHTNIECDGCGEAPILGVRYKCSVLENFDYCSTCEERLGHEHPFLKITQDGGAPDVMITMLNENQPGREDGTEQPMRRGGRGGRGRCGPGRGGRGGRGGRHGMGGMGGFGGHGNGGFGKMMKAFLGDVNIDDVFKQVEGEGEQEIPEWMKNMKDQFVKHQAEWKEGKGGKGCNQWKNKRATLVSKPEDVLDVTPDQVIMPELEIQNGTYWPWKADCSLTLDDEQDLSLLPVQMINVPVLHEVKGQQTFKITVPIQVLAHAVAEDKVHEINLCFRGPNGHRFGESIPLKLRVVMPMPMSETEFYAQALKLHEQKHGSFDECVAALKMQNYDVAEAIKHLDLYK